MGREQLPLVFDDVSLHTETVRISGRAYTLREADSGVASIFRNAQIRCARLGSNGKPTSVDGIASTQILLVSLCLFDEGGKAVSQEALKTFPERVVKPIFERIMDVSNLRETETVASLRQQIREIEERIAELTQEEEERKNVLCSSTAGSP